MGFSPEQNQPQQQTQHIIVQPEIHIDPPAHIKPDLDKKVRIILTAPSDIRRAIIEMSPHNNFRLSQ